MAKETMKKLDEKLCLDTCTDPILLVLPPLPPEMPGDTGYQTAAERVLLDLANTEANMTFSASQEVTALCQNYGTVYAAQDLCPSKCHVTGKGLEVAVVGEMSTAVLQTVNFRG